MSAPAQDSFYQSLPAFRDFADVARFDRYQPLPDGWLLATSDIVGSTKAIEAGHYRAVNMAGASVISASVKPAAPAAEIFIKRRLDKGDFLRSSMLLIPHFINSIRLIQSGRHWLNRYPLR